MRPLVITRTVAALTLGTMLTSSVPSYAYDDYSEQNPGAYGQYDSQQPPYQAPPQAPPRPAPGYGLPFGMSKSAAGALTGAVLGAGSGAIIGSHRGKAGKGALIGAGVGAVGGFLVGKQIQNQDESLNAQQQVINQQRQEIDRNQELINELKRRQLDARETKRGVVVNLPDVLFEYDKANLTRDAQEKVHSIAAILERRATGRRIAVEGHTDSIGSDAYNLRLSQRRAETVARDLAYNGVPENRLQTQGFGEKYPVAPNTYPDGADNPAGRAKNRRVEVVIEN